jgi:formylglycine-generating enzyme required for sulfatase activity
MDAASKPDATDGTSPQPLADAAPRGGSPVDGSPSDATRMDGLPTEAGLAAADASNIADSSVPDASAEPATDAAARDAVSSTLDAATQPGPDLPRGFIRVEAGVFTMGSPLGELGRIADLPQQDVEILAPFALQATEVTQAEWQAVMGDNPSGFGPNGERAACGPNCPVERVSWFDAVAYLNRLSDAEALTRCYSDDAEGLFNGPDCDGYRLPTEAEWEYAARAGSSTAFPGGDIVSLGCRPLDPNLDAVGWYCGNSGDTTHSVGLKQANAWGLFDMHGNVAEWVQGALDVYARPNGSFGGGALPDPGMFQNRLGDTRVVRGGAWFDTSEWTRAAVRLAPLPGDVSNGIGFRAARTL